MNTTRKQKHLAACLRGGDHQRSERRTRQPAVQGKPPYEGTRADAAGQTAGSSNYRGSYTSPNGAAKGRRKLRFARLTSDRDSGPECSKPSAGPQKRRMKNEI
jgi:hypothetical protein